MVSFFFYLVTIFNSYFLNIIIHQFQYTHTFHGRPSPLPALASSLVAAAWFTNNSIIVRDIDIKREQHIM